MDVFVGKFHTLNVQRVPGAKLNHSISIVVSRVTKPMRSRNLLQVVPTHFGTKITIVKLDDSWW